MSFCKVIFVSLNVAFVFAIGDQIIFPVSDTLHLYSACIIKSFDNRNDRGICTKLNECYQIKKQIRNSIYNHTVCGYEREDQIVCCPSPEINTTEIVKHNALREIGATIINLMNLNCTTKITGQNGVLKFTEDCPELNDDRIIGYQDFCNHEICKNLVCCPITPESPRYNPVCQNVDQVDIEIRFRLDVNMPCTVKGLNITGTYQQKCDAYDRNEILEENVIELCTNKTCNRYYCCPVLNRDDVKRCNLRRNIEFPLIEFIGPKCIDSLTNLAGRCRQLENCPKYTQGRKYMDRCGTECCTEFYCCPDEDYGSQSTSMQKCLGYRSTVFRKQITIETLYQTESQNTRCSISYFPHAAGLRANPGTFPHMAALGYAPTNNSTLQWNCGGSLISEKYILTAGHCLETQHGQVKTIRLGSLHLENVRKSDECAEDFGVKRVIPHPLYNRKFVYNDIGLIELDREVKFNFHMRPICLPSSDAIPNRVIGMGWGLLGTVGDKSDTLYYGHLDSYTYQECNKSYESNLNRRVLNGIDGNTQFCVGSRETIQSSCDGDSGGPVISEHNIFERLFEIYGIISFGTVCGFANSPGVCTKVHPYVKWIESVVW